MQGHVGRIYGAMQSDRKGFLPDDWKFCGNRPLPEEHLASSSMFSALERTMSVGSRTDAC